MRKRLLILAILIENIAMTGMAHGDMLTDFTQKAVLKNPEVVSRWHALKAATEEIGVARGTFFPGSI